MKLYDPLTSRRAGSAEGFNPAAAPIPQGRESFPESNPTRSPAWDTTTARQTFRLGASKLESRGVHALLAAVLLGCVAGGFGYYLRAFGEPTISTLAAREIPSVGYFVSTLTFSEVAEAKALLEASAEQIIQELRERPGAGVARVNASVIPRGEGSNSPYTRAVRDLESSIAEFKGTAQEIVLSQEMLWLLWRESQYDRFVEVYLNTLYEHPTAGLVGRFAGKALQSSRIVGREEEMLKAFRQVTSIPTEFVSKRQVIAALEATALVAQASLAKDKASL